MPNRTYIKKPITDEIRECKLAECKIMFEPTREDQRFCCRKHGERDWRLKHPRKTIYKPITWRNRLVKDPRRDTLQAWTKYMRQNPLYYNTLGDCRDIGRFFGKGLD